MRLRKVSREEKHVEKLMATFHFKKRSKPLHYYQSMVLRYYRPYLVYYKKMLRKEVIEELPKVEKPLEKSIEEKRVREELIKIPVRGIDVIVSYAKNVEASIEYVPRYLPKLGKIKEIPVMVFPNRYSAMRHLIFSLTYATLRSMEKVERLREIVNGLNINIIEPFYSTALFRYYELRNSSDLKWHWKVLRIGRAFKVMYMLDR